MNKSDIMNWIKKSNHPKAEKESTTGAKIAGFDELYW